jgi:hypothetical protein
MADSRAIPGRLRVGCTLVFALVVLRGQAHAAEPIAVETIIRQGVELRRKGRDQEALPLFQRAYDLERSPRTAAQLGLVELSMGYALAAERHLQEALSSPRHFWVNRNRAELDTALAQARANIGELTVQGEPVGAEVLVNGKSVGVLPRREPVRLVEGAAELVVTAPGFQKHSATLAITGGQRQTVAVTLKPPRQPPHRWPRRRHRSLRMKRQPPS